MELLTLNVLVVNDEENIVFNKTFWRGNVGCRLNLEEKLVLGTALQGQTKSLTFEDRQQIIYMPSEQQGYSDEQNRQAPPCLSDIYSLLAEHIKRAFQVV